MAEWTYFLLRFEGCNPRGTHPMGAKVRIAALWLGSNTSGYKSQARNKSAVPWRVFIVMLAEQLASL